MNPAQLLAQFDRIAKAPDAIHRLRRFILDLAVRGKLVEQDPRDEAASELLKRIQAIKARGNSARWVRKSKLALSPNDIPFSIPKNWEWVPLGDVVRIRTGKLDANAAVKGGAYPFFTCSQTPSEIDNYSFDTSAVLLAGNGDFNLKCYKGKFDAYQRTYVIEPLEWDLSFCFILMKSQISRITENHRGSAIPYLKLGDIADPVIPFPALAEQHRIVAKVDELMALCDRLEATQTERENRRDRLVASSLNGLNNGADAETFRGHARFYSNYLQRLTTRPEHIKQLRQTILNLAVRGKLVPQDPTDEPASELLKRIQIKKAKLLKEGTITRQNLASSERKDLAFDSPMNWQPVKFNDLCNLVTSGSRGWAEFYSDTGPKFIRAQNIRFGKLQLDALAHVNLPRKAEGTRTQVSKGDLLIVITGAGVTNPALLDDELGEAYVSQHVALIKPTAKSISHWLLLCLMAPAGARDELVECAYGAGKPGLNLNNIRSLTIPLPPLAEQHRIVAKVDALMALCDQLETQLTTTQSESRHLLEAILHYALSA